MRPTTNNPWNISGALNHPNPASLAIVLPTWANCNGRLPSSPATPWSCNHKTDTAPGFPNQQLQQQKEEQEQRLQQQKELREQQLQQQREQQEQRLQQQREQQEQRLQQEQQQKELREQQLQQRDHQDYYNQNNYAGYCMAVISPKIQKLKKMYADKLKETA